MALRLLLAEICLRLATTLRWVSTTPVGSPDVPDEDGITSVSRDGSMGTAGGR